MKKILFRRRRITALISIVIRKKLFLQNRIYALSKLGFFTKQDFWRRKQSDKINPIKQYTRYIFPYLKKQIWERDQGQCTYAHPKSQGRCTSKHLLQIDHIRPFSLRGRTTLKNLRLLCAGHNQFRNGRAYKNEKNPCFL